MTYLTTLKSCLEYVGAIFPTSVFEATLHAVALGAVEARRGEVRYWHIVQEVTACQPELLDWPATLTVSDMKQEQRGMIFLEGDMDAVFLFRIPLEVVSHQERQPM